MAGAWAGDKDNFPLEVQLCLEEMEWGHREGAWAEGVGWMATALEPGQVGIVSVPVAERKCPTSRVRLATV